ncbi:MAG: hypothetical protein ABSC19_13260 [Syntrophorhabdales bacterium]|jgi:hypothetical protein
MEHTPTGDKPWQKKCCGKRTFADLLDEQGLCDYCRELAAMKASPGKEPR